uniref:Uncharacterized protein n=2 Tax=Amphimedon queenslandica TaxID=400682 RepID=A0A1X7U3S1_AMPQE
PSSGFIELLFDDSCEGWTVQPLVEPCRLYQDDIDRFDEATYPLPPSCLVSVHGSPDAVPTLHYSVPLVGVAEPVTLCVDRKLQLEKDVLEVIASHKATFEKEKDRGIAESMKKLYESLKKQSILAKEKQELSERLLALIKEQELPKQQGPDDKEEQELKSELQETKAILDIYISKQQEQKAVEETLKTDIYLKDKTIADLVQEKSQLSKEMSQLLEEISELKTEKENDFTSKLKEINSNNEKILSRQEEIQTKSQDLMTILTDSDRIISELFVKTEETEKDFDEQLQKDDRAEKQRQLQENISTALSVQQESMKEGSDLMQELSENNDLLENVIESSKYLQKKHTTCTYAGLVYYEEHGVENLVTFTAVRKLDALLEFIKKKHPQAKLGPHVYFRIASPDGFVELDFNAPQDEPFTGWSIEPHTTPCRLYQRDIYNFGDKDYSLPPSCLVSVYGSPDAVPTLLYSVPLVGVADPVTLHIHVSRRNTPIAVGAASAGSSTQSVKRERGFDIKTAKQKIKQVMIENHSDFADILESSLKEIANKLFEAKIVTQQVQRSPTYDAIAYSFLAIMNLFDSKSDLEKHCVKYLEALSSVGGQVEFAANLLREKWTAALEGTLQFEQSVKRVDDNI